MPYIKEFPAAPLLYAFVGATVLWLAAGLITRKRFVTFSALWFAVLSVPYMFVPAIVKNVAITAERYIYVPSIGMAMLAGWAIAARWSDEKLRPKLKAAAIFVLVIYGVLGTVYFYQAWHTEEDFWRHAIKTNPEYVSAYANLATIELQKGNMAEAEALLLEGLGREKGLPEEFSQAAYALANVYGGEGDFSRAEKYYVISLSHADFEFAYMELGYLYLDAERWGEAREALEGTLKFRRNPRVLAGLAFASLRLGDKEAAGAYAGEAYTKARDEGLKDFALFIMKEVRN
jgi:tetratricopeptide (TPR) repeat protein